MDVRFRAMLLTVAFALSIFDTQFAGGQERPAVVKLFRAPDDIDAVFTKVLTRNDDSGRHGVLIPVAAWRFFPEFEPQSERTNATTEVTTVWTRDGKLHRESTNWKHYGRYPERRLTGLRSQRLDNKPALSVIVLGRRRENHRVFEARVVYPDDPAFETVIQSVGLESSDLRAGQFALQMHPHTTARVKRTPALREFLRRFDKIKSRGFVRTLRPGSTGVGYTLETLLGISENNSPAGDFMGMELKAYRDEQKQLNDTGKMNLFLKEPKWLDGLRSAERIKKYGYVDSKGRASLYSTVTVKENSHGLGLKLDEPQRRLFLLFRGERIGEWTFGTLESRLIEKHQEAAFVAVRSRGKGYDEEFLYHTVTWCSRPSAAALRRLIQSGDAMLELRMHVKANGSARNHGSAFRVRKNKLTRLYEATLRCR